MNVLYDILVNYLYASAKGFLLNLFAPTNAIFLIIVGLVFVFLLSRVAKWLSVLIGLIFILGGLMAFNGMNFIAILPI